MQGQNQTQRKFNVNVCTNQIVGKTLRIFAQYDGTTHKTPSSKVTHRALKKSNYGKQIKILLHLPKLGGDK